MVAMSQLMLDIFGAPPLRPVYLLTIFDPDVLAKPARARHGKKDWRVRFAAAVTGDTVRRGLF